MKAATSRFAAERADLKNLQGIARCGVALAGMLLGSWAFGQSDLGFPFSFTTLAGTAGAAGSSDGTGVGAQFNAPEGVAVDGSGNIFVADSGNHTIRKVTPSGVVTTIAGSAGLRGSLDGTGSSARFFNPKGLTVDGSGNIYVADSGNDTIRKIVPATAGGITSWIVSTVAGTPGVAGSLDGPASTAQFDFPTSVSLDNAGNIYVADSGDTIRFIATNGSVTTLAGEPGVAGSADGTGSAARFGGLMFVAASYMGGVTVADTYNDTIRSVSTAGVVETFAGAAGLNGSSDDYGIAARFYGPAGLALDSAGNFWIADSQNNTIREVFGLFNEWSFGPPSTTWIVDTVAGMPGSVGSTDGAGELARFSNPYCVAVDSTDPFAPTLYVADTGNNTIRKGELAEIVFATLPASQTIAEGSTVVFTVAVQGLESLPSEAGATTTTGTVPPPTYQWQYSAGGGPNWIPLIDGNGIRGSTGPQLVIQGAALAESGTYQCLVTIGDVVGFPSAYLQVVAGAAPGAVSAFSARAAVGTGNGILIDGFYIAGSTSATVLIQAIGPALSASPYDVAAPLAEPVLSVHQNQHGQDVTLCSNTGWNSAGQGEASILSSAAVEAGALPTLQPGSADSEVLLTLPPGGYTVEVSGANGGTGVALCAVYQLP